MTDSPIQFDRVCPRCKVRHPLTAFPKNRAMIDGRGAYCRPCWSKYQMEYRAARKVEYAAKVAALSPEDRARLGT